MDLILKQDNLGEKCPCIKKYNYFLFSKLAKNIFIFFIFYHIYFCTYSFAQIKGDPDLLLIAGNANMANKESILSWNGNAVFNETITEFVNEKKIEKKSITKIDFAFDRLSEKTFFFAEKNSPDGREIWGNIKTKKGVYELFPWNGDRVNGPVNVPFVSLRSRQTHGRSAFLESLLFDPFCFFEMEGSDINERLGFFYRDLKNKNLSHVSVSKNKNIMHFHLDRSGNFFNHFSIDLDRGANPVRVDLSDNIFLVEKSQIFELNKNTWLPKTAIKISKNHDNGKIHVINVKIENKSFNKKLKNNCFSLEKFGLIESDEINDQIKNVTYKYSLEKE